MVAGSLLYYILFTLLALVSLTVYFAVFLLTALFDRRRVVLHWVGRAWSRAIYGICPLWRVRVTGKENVERGMGRSSGIVAGAENGTASACAARRDARSPQPATSAAYVVVANHQAYLDIPLLYRLPLHFKWVSKREVLRIPLFGAVLWMQNNIVIRRGEAADAKMFLSQGERWLKKGVSVVVFPEGTRSPSGAMRRFHEGAFLLAKKAGAPILPVATDGTGSVSEGWKVRMPHTFRVSILPPVSAGEVASTGVKEMAAKVREMIAMEREMFLKEKK